MWSWRNGLCRSSHRSLSLWELLEALRAREGNLLGLDFLHVRKKSILKEIELLKQCPKKGAPQSESAKPCHCAKVRCAILLAAAALALFGFFSGGTADVLTKAVNICTECIGLG